MTSYIVRALDYGPTWTAVIGVILVALCIRAAIAEGRLDG